MCCFQPSGNASDTDEERQEGATPAQGSSRLTEEALHLPPHLQCSSQQVVWAEPVASNMEMDSPSAQVRGDGSGKTSEGAGTVVCSSQQVVWLGPVDSNMEVDSPSVQVRRDDSGNTSKCAGTAVC